MRRGTPSIYIPYVSEYISWSLNVSGRESVVGAGADSTTSKTITSRASRLLIHDGVCIYPVSSTVQDNGKELEKITH